MERLLTVADDLLSVSSEEDRFPRRLVKASLSEFACVSPVRVEGVEIMVSARAGILSGEGVVDDGTTFDCVGGRPTGGWVRLRSAVASLLGVAGCDESDKADILRGDTVVLSTSSERRPFVVHVLVMRLSLHDSSTEVVITEPRFFDNCLSREQPCINSQFVMSVMAPSEETVCSDGGLAI